MFFRHHKPKTITFSEYLQQARGAGFTVTEEGSGRFRIGRDGIAALVEKGELEFPRFVARAGLVLNGSISALVDGGFQKFFETPAKMRKPAQAADLRAIHNFQEDLREALGLTSLYNESLGTVSTRYLYDRVEERDAGKANHPWQTRMNNE